MATQAAKSANKIEDIKDHLCDIPIINKFKKPLAPKVRNYIEDCIRLCKPDAVYFCDGSELENEKMLKLLEKRGTVEALSKYKNCWLARTNPADVARVESKTFICTDTINETIPTPRNGVKGTLGNWMSPSDMDKAVIERFPGCMKGKKKKKHKLN